MIFKTLPSTTALTAAAAIVDEVAANAASKVSFFSPQCTGVATTASVTVNLIRADTGAIIGSTTVTNSGAGASAVGPIYVEAIVPAGNAGTIEVSAVMSSGTGTLAGTATAPCVTTVIP